MASPNRTNSQKLVTLHVDGSLFDATERIRGSVSRSQWIREAILEKLRAEGLELPDDAAAAPDRAGVGGPKPKKVVGMPPALKVAEDHGEAFVSERKKVNYRGKKRP